MGLRFEYNGSDSNAPSTRLRPRHTFIMKIPASPQPHTDFNFPEVLVVEASAGSGKTYALAKRYVQLLMMEAAAGAGQPAQAILALTFTNKAAFEMKERILFFLKGIALQQLPAHDRDNILGPLHLEPGRAAELAFGIMDAIIHQYHFFQVQTIDKFINTLLSGCAFKVGLTSRFRIKTTAYDYLEYSLDRLIDQAAEDKELLRVFEGFLDNYLYLENRTGWFPKKDVLDVVKGLYGQINHYGIAFATSGVAGSDLSQAKRRVLEKIKAWREVLPEKTHARFVSSLEKFLREHHYTFDIDSLPNFSAETPPLNKGAEAGPDVYAGWDEIQRDIHRLCLQEAYSLYNPYIEVFDKVIACFDRFAAEDDVLFLEELNRKAQRLFDAEGVTVEELYFRLATRLRHFLIDEFQDTSRLQWLNLRMMPEEALAGGGSLFYVGDRKQAIYSFRGGDVRLFDEIQQEFADYTRCESLSNNFRSQKAIVEFNNQIFSLPNLQRFVQAKEQRERDSKSKKEDRVEFHGDEYRRLENIFGNARQTHQADRDAGYVEVERVDEDSKSERLEHTREYMLTVIAELRTRFEWRDMAVLTRENTQVETVTNWLLEEGIPVDSERTSNIKDNDRIREIIALLTFLDSPVDNVAFAEFIMGRVFAAAAGLTQEDMRAFVFRHRNDLRRQRNFYLYQAFRRAYPKAWDRYLDDLYRNVGLYPLYELVITLYERLDCLQQFPADQGFFMLLLELIKKREEEYSDIVSFLEYFEDLRGEDLYAHVPGLNAVKVLTVHKSKGLEFPVVFLPFLRMDVKVGSKTSDAAQSYLLLREADRLKLLRLKKPYYRYSDELYQIYRSEYVDAFISELNNVYVALTRASHEMYICLPRKAGQGFNLATLLIPDDVTRAGDKTSYPPRKPKGRQELMRLEHSRHQDWITYLNDEHLAYQQAGHYESRLAGTALHEILAGLKADRTEQLEVGARQAVEEVLGGYPEGTWKEDVRRRVEEAVRCAEFQPFFVNAVGKILTEHEVVDVFGHTKRIDRLIVTDQDVTVVDYKSTAQEQKAGQDQVRSYMQLMASIYPKRRVRGFLMYMEELRLEEVDG